MKLSNIMKAYKDCDRASISINVNGKVVYPSEHYQLDTLEVELSIKQEINHVFMKLCEIEKEDVIDNMYLCGSKVVVKIGYFEKEIKVFTGYVHYVKSNYVDVHLQEMHVYLQDVKGLMKLSSHYKYANKNINLLVSDLLKQPLYTSYIDDIIIGNIPEHFKKLRFTQKDNDYDFMCYLSNLLHFDFYCDSEHLYFQNAYRNKQVTLDFDSDSYLLYTEVIHDVQKQMGNYRVVGYGKNYAQLAYQGKHNISSLPYTTNMKKVMNSKQYLILDEGADIASLQAYGMSESEKCKHQFLKVNIMMRLFPDVVCGDIIRITIAKQLKNKKVYVESIKHEITKYTSHTFITGSMID